MAIVLRNNPEIATPRERRVAAAIERAREFRHIPDGSDFWGWRSESAHGMWVKLLLERVANAAAYAQADRIGISCVDGPTRGEDL